MTIKIIGCESDCDLVIAQTGVAAVHARLELTENGHVYLLDAGSDFNTYLNRNGQWIRIHKIRLCVADQIRIGEHELPLSQLISVFGRRADIRLGDEHVSMRHHKAARAAHRDGDAPASSMQRPRRNPLTGKIEQNQIEQSQSD